MISLLINSVSEQLLSHWFAFTLVTFDITAGARE